jgi:hypothetical protein
MDFNDAISAHTAWKKKLKERLDRCDRTVDPAVVGRDDACALGQWIKSQGEGHRGLREFAEMQSCHTHFHKAAADLVRRALKDPEAVREMIVGANSEFTTASTALVRSLLVLRQRTAKLKGRVAHA